MPSYISGRNRLLQVNSEITLQELNLFFDIGNVCRSITLAMSSLILYYDGQLEVTADFTPSYTGGRNRPLQINTIITLEELKSLVIRTLRRDSTSVTVKLVARIRNNGGHIAIIVDDDESCEFILTQSRRRNIIVFVEFEELPQQHMSQSPNFEETLEEQQTQSNPNSSIRLPPIHQQPNVQARHSVSSRPTYLEENPIGIRSISDRPSSSVSHSRGRLSLSDRPVMIETFDLSQHTTIADEENAYDTMGSESTQNSSENNANDAGGNQVNIPTDTTINLPGHEHVRAHAFTNISNLEDMNINNEYVQLFQTAEEWDARDDIDEPLIRGGALLESVIPDHLTEGLTFPSKEALQFSIIGWSIMNNVEFEKTTSNKSKLTLQCKQHKDPVRPCMWRLHGSKSKRLGGSWKISTYRQPHTCLRPIISQGHKNCNSKFICYFITGILRQQIDMKPREIIARVESRFNIKLSYSKAWNARKKAINSVFGSYEESYCSLCRLMAAVTTAIPGTVYNIQHDESSQFRGIFWSFGPSIQGWSYCRPVLSLDGTFLLGKYRGTLLAAVGFDGNGGLYPLAFAVVESESNETWLWFLQKLFHLVAPVRNRGDLCFISDKHPGIVRGCRDIFPRAAHRHCLRHLRENFKKAVRRMAIQDCDTLCNKMYAAGNTDDMDVFNRNVLEIQQIKQEAYDWLYSRDFTKWTLTHDGGSRYGVMTTNASECFNGVLRRARGLPIQGLIVAIYYNLVAVFLKRTNNVNNWIESRTSVNVPRINNILMSYENAARTCPEATCINNEEFQVFDMSCRSFRVDILSPNSVKCTCSKPQIYHYPCVHAIAAASCKRWDYNAFVSSYYTLNNYKETYAGQFHTIPEKSQWPPYRESSGIRQLLPPPYRRRAGRPKSIRYRNTMDEPRPLSGRQCGLCKQIGHNRATCPSNPSSSRSARTQR